MGQDKVGTVLVDQTPLGGGRQRMCGGCNDAWQQLEGGRILGLPRYDE